MKFCTIPFSSQQFMRDLKVASYIPRPRRSSVSALLGMDFLSAPVTGAHPRVQAAQRGRTPGRARRGTLGQQRQDGLASPARSSPPVPAVLWSTAHPRSPAAELKWVEEGSHPCC